MFNGTTRIPFPHQHLGLLPLPALSSARARGDSGAQDTTPLIWAARNGKGAAVTTLVENGASLDLQDNYGSTALLIASYNNYPSIVKYLVGMGANQTLKDSDGTALDNATKKGNAEVVAILKNPEKVGASSFPSYILQSQLTQVI